MARFIGYEPCPSCRKRGADRAGDNLGMYSDGSGHCWSCGYHLHPKFTLKLFNEEPEDATEKAVLPADFTRDVPAEGWKWLLQYGLGWKYWSPFVGWSEAHQRLVFTVGEPTGFSVGRFLGDAEAFDRPPRKWYVWGNSHERAHVVGYGTTGPVTVVVEDLISAHKVGQVTPCIPLFGTRVFASAVATLRNIGLPVLMWLDKDQENHAVKRADQLAMLTGLAVRYVSTDSDPKCLTSSKIGEIVNSQVL